MKLYRIIDISESLKLGREPGRVEIAVDPTTMPPDARAVLAVSLSRHDPALIVGEFPRGISTDGVVDLPTLTAAIDTALTRIEKSRTEQKVRDDKGTADRETEKSRYMAMSPAKLLCVADPRWVERRLRDLGLSELADRVADLEKERQDNREAESARITAEKEARQQAGVAALLSWVGNNGSEFLRARIEGDYEWINLARQEFADTVLAPLSGFVRAGGDNLDDVSPRRTPTMAEIARLAQVRELLTGKPVVASLVWAKYENPTNDETDLEGENWSGCEISVDVSTPDGETITRLFQI